MTNDLTTLIGRVRESVGTAEPSAPSSDQRQKLQRIAQEFESMLLVQMFKDMRRAGKWDEDDGDGEDKSGLGAESLFEMADAELAGHFARVQGLGLSKQLLAAFDRMKGMGLNGPQVPVAPTIPELVPMDGTTPALAPVQTVPLITPTSVLPSPVAGSPTVPTVDGHVTSQFGWRRDPFTGQSRFHRGVDLAAVYGQDVQAARAGRVVFSGGQAGYGNTVVVEHGDGTRTRYAHLSATLVARGEAVDAGQPVGRAGHSGRATGTHVHFEVTSADGRPMAPDEWLKQS